MGSLADQTVVYIEQVSLNMQLIEKMNESNCICKVLGVLETDPNDPQLAKKVAIENPTADENASLSLTYLTNFIEEVVTSKNGDEKRKKVFRAVLDALLDVRLRLPPIYNFIPGNILIDTETLAVKIVITEDLFKRESQTVKLSRDDLLYKSPEELLGRGKSLTTPFWVLGCLLYEAKFGANPFRTHLKTQVTEEFIKFYPCMFPEDQDPPSEAFSSLILHLLIKDPLQRLGSDSFEKEMLEHPYFQIE